MHKREELNHKSQEILKQYAFMSVEMLKTEISDRFVVQEDSLLQYFYYRITQISRRWISEKRPIWEQMTEMFVGMEAIAVPFSVLFVGDGNELGVYVGTSAEYMDILNGMMHSTFPMLQYAKSDDGSKTRSDQPTENLYQYDEAVSMAGSVSYRGVLKGNPTGSEQYLGGEQLDALIKGMHGKPWTVALFAYPTPKNDRISRQQSWIQEATRCSELTEVNFSETNNFEVTSYKRTFHHVEQYNEKVQAFCEKSLECQSLGEWCVSITFGSDSPENAKLLGGLLVSAFYGEESKPEPVHAMYMKGRSDALLFDGMQYTHTNFAPNIPYPKYSTLMSSRELAVVASPPTMDTAGFAVIDHVEFDVHREAKGSLSLGRILNGGRITQNEYTIDPNELNRHCLVVGLTGSGKTNTVKSIICGMTKESKRPLMVIEPAKKEYWELYKLGYTDLQVYTVGACEPYAHKLCLNPFERAVFTDENGVRKSVPIQTHIDFVYAAFKASFIMYTPMPYVLERAIYEIYEDCGWDIHHNVNTSGREIYPTIEDLYYKIPDVVTAMGYDQKMRNDLIGSLQARINSMRLGTKGDTLNVRRSFPMDKLLSGNVVIELEDIGDDDVKAFIISLILVALLEYRRQQKDCQREVQHLMLIEEAHRLLKNVHSGTGENADPRGAAVEFFCNLLAELRSKGQGFVIADQIPSKLAPDLIKNTNLKIAHRNVADEERRLIGGAMHMTEEQIDYLSSLKQGVAAMYSEHDHRPKLVNPPYAGVYLVPEYESMTREDVLRAGSANVISADGQKDYASLTDAQSRVCLHCQKMNKHQCDRRPSDAILNKTHFYEYFKPIDPRTEKCTAEKLHTYIQKYLQEEAGCVPNPEKAHYCALHEIVEYWRLSKGLETKLLNIYLTEY